MKTLGIQILIAFISSTLAHSFCNIDATSSKDIFGLIASLSATLLGFVFTALSILIAVPDRGLITALKESGHYNLLVREMFKASAILFISSVISIIFLVAPKQHYEIMLSLLTFVYVFALSMFVRVGHKFYLLITHINT